MNLREPKSPTRKLVQLINAFRKLSGYKISMQKISSLSIYQSKHTEEKIREAVSLTTILKTDQQQNLRFVVALCKKSLATKPGS